MSEDMQVSPGPGLFADGHADGAKSWWKRFGGTWLFKPEPAEMVMFMADDQYTVIGTHAHGSRLSIWFGAKALSTVKVAVAMKGKPKKRFVLMLNCYSFESGMTEELIGQHGCAITFRGTIAAKWALPFTQKVIDQMFAEPGKPIYQIWLGLKRRWLSSFQPQFQGNETITYNDILRPYLSKPELMSAVAQWYENEVSTQDVDDLLDQYFDERR